MPRVGEEDLIGGPPPDGFGVRELVQGGELVSRTLICEKCKCLVPDDLSSAEGHQDFHRSLQAAALGFGVGLGGGRL